MRRKEYLVLCLVVLLAPNAAVWGQALPFQPGLGTEGADPQEDFAGDLVLRKTYIKTAGELRLQPLAIFNEKEALTPTIVSCPGPAGSTCTLRIELSALFSQVPPGTVAGAGVWVDGAADGIGPSNLVALDSTSNGPASNVRTFAWLKKDLAPGLHIVEVSHLLVVIDQSRVPIGKVLSATRTLTLQVFKP